MQITQKKMRLPKPFVKRLIGFFEQGLFAPFLLTLQSVLYIYLINSTEVYFSESLRAILVSILFGAIVLSLVNLIVRDWQKSSLIASLFIFLFFLFGDVSDWVVDTFELRILQADLLFLAVVIVYMILWVWFVQNRIKDTASINLYFNLLGVLLLAYCAVSVRNSELGNRSSMKRDALMPVAAVESMTSRPDIYYIVLDGYAREDILKALYEFDNTDFLAALKTRGLYIAEESSSNYVQTMLSVSSSLNMDYLQSLRADGIDLENRQDLTELLVNSKVRNILAQNGYQLVSFRNSSHVSIPNAEIYYDGIGTGLAQPLTAFESNMINRTLARVLLHIPFFNKVLIETPYDTHRNQVLATFERLQEIPALDGDYFVYAHIIVPHPPFVFNENGDALSHTEPFTLSDGNNYIRDHSCESFIAGYRTQIRYVNRLVLQIIDSIMITSETAPIIIIQGDHGPGSQFSFASLEETLPAERFSILNAYYFPDQDYTRLYASISPVNTFRVLLDQFFGETYELLPDRHYYSTWSTPFDFIEITDFSLPEFDQD